MSSNSNDYSHLKELGKSGYEIADGESDIRSWVVKNESGNILGEVDELIFDTTARKAVFIVLDLNRNELNLKERKILLPLEYAEVHESYKNVVYKGLTPNEIAVLPTYEKGKITRNSIDQTRSTFLTSMTDAGSSPVQSDHHQAVSQPDTRQTSFGSSDHSYSEHYRSANTVSNAEQNDQHRNAMTAGEHGNRSYTVIGVFDNSRQTQAVMEYLQDHGYDRGDITVSTRQKDLTYDRHHHDENSITQFFKSLFNNDDDVKRYSDVSDRNYVISVDVSTPEQAEETANILDQHGSLNMKPERTAEKEPTGNTRVFKRHTRS